MHILCLSHAGCIPANQSLYVELANIEDVELTLVVPAQWRNEFSGKEFPAQRHPDLVSRFVTQSVTFAGGIHHHYYAKGLQQLAAAIPPDLIYVDEEPWSFVAWQAGRLAQRIGCPWVFHSNQNLNRKYPPPFNWIQRRSFGTAAAAVVCGVGARNTLENKGFQRSIRVIPYSVDLPESANHPPPTPPLVTREALGLRGMVVGYMARLTEEKGVLLWLEAMRRLSRRLQGRDYSGLLVGDGPLRSLVEQTIGGDTVLKERIVFVGSIPHDHVNDYFACMDVFVLPSVSTPRWVEQFGRVLVHALACGVPVVGSDCGEIPHLVADLQGGTVFREGDVEDLTDKVADLVLDERTLSHLAEQGYTRVLKKYSHLSVARQFHELFHEVLEHEL